MRNGNAVAVRTFVLAISIMSTGGCDLGTAPPPSPSAARAAPQGVPPGMRYQADARRNRIWVLTEAGVFVYDAARPERMAVSLPGWVTVDAVYGCLPDMALGPSGEAVITSNIVPTLWRVDPDTLAVSVHSLALDADNDKDVGFSGLAYSPQHGAFLAASFHHGSLWRIDPLLERGQKIPLSAPIPEACGLAVRPPGATQALRPAADACVLTRQGGFAVTFTPRWRSAYVSAVQCTDAP